MKNLSQSYKAVPSSLCKCGHYEQYHTSGVIPGTVRGCGCLNCDCRGFVSASEQPALTDRFLHALELAVEAHRRQTDKAGDPYIWHAIRVGASLLPDEEAAVVGLLHDVLEDCMDYAHWAGRIRCIVSDRQWQAIRALTRKETETYQTYITYLSAYPGSLIRKVKIADIYDNLRPDRLVRAAANDIDVARLVRKYTHALRVLQPEAFLTTADPIDSSVNPEDSPL